MMDKPGIVFNEPEENVDSNDEDPAGTSSNTWIPVPNPHPSQIKARFSITQIEVTPQTPESDTSQDFDEEFLKYLIDEGIPVKVLSHSDSEESVDNAGIIRTNTDKNKTKNSTETESSKSDLLSPSNLKDDVIQITGMNQTIAKPLFLKYVPSIADLKEEFEDLGIDTNVASRKHSVISVEMPIPLPKPGGTDTPNSPIKKKVRFDLPKRKASIIGVYEYLPSSPPDVPDLLSQTKINEIRKSWLSPPPSPRRFSEDEDIESALESQHFLKRLLYNYRPSIDLGIHEDEEGVGNDHNNGESATTKEDLPHHADLRCGCNSWSPDWLQEYARKEWYLAVFCVAGLVQGMLYTYNVAVISTLKKRFNFSSSVAGVILLGNDISQILLSIIIAFFGTYGHRPRWLGTGAIISAVAALVAATPHLIYGAGYITPEGEVTPGFPFLSNIDSELCSNEQAHEEGCHQSSESETFLFPAVILFLSQFMIGMATSIFWTLGVSYLDDNTNKKETPLYFAVFQVLRVLGPPLGFLFGHYCLTFWIDPYKEVSMSPYDPRYMGAWWIGFLVLAFLIGSSGTLYFCFPRRLPSKCDEKEYFDPLFQIEEEGLVGTKIQSKKNQEEEREGATYSFLESARGSFYLPSIKALPQGLKRLFTNKIWVANFVSNVAFVMAMSGYWKFKPKYIEIQFHKTPSAATFYTGMATMVASVLGIGASGLVFRLWKPKAKSVTAYNVFLSIFAIGSLFALMAVRCSPIKIAGHVPHKETWACSTHCSCSEKFNPVCAQDGVTNFFSPCYAGCSTAILTENEIEYSNCTCTGTVTWKINANASSEKEAMEPHLENGWAVPGFCPENCKAFSYYLGLQILTKMIFATGKVNGMLVNLRSVREKDKTLALGCMTVGIALLGFLPASLFISRIIDSTCLVWENTCQGKGSCWYYDSDRFGLLLHVVPAAILLLSVVGDIVVYLNHSKLNFYGDESHQMKKIEDPVPPETDNNSSKVDKDTPDSKT